MAAANVDLEIKIFGSKSLFKPREQYKPLSRGQLDMTVLPLSYAGGQQPAYNLTLERFLLILNRCGIPTGAIL